MPNTIKKIKKGLNIPIEGEAPKSIIGNINGDVLKIYPEDFAGITPKVTVKIGDLVKAGSPIMYDKNIPEILFVSPVSGEIVAIERGEKRKLIYIAIKSNGLDQSESIEKKDVNSISADDIKSDLLKFGLWTFIKQRPYDVIADPRKSPRDIFVSGFSSAPLAPSFDFVLEKEASNLQTGFDILNKLTNGKVYLGISPQTQLSSLRNAKNVIITEFDGPHPTGNVGVQINNIAPVNKGETVWTISAIDLVYWGRFFNEGILKLDRLVAYTGSEAVKKGYYRMTIGSSIESLIEGNTTKGKLLRIISGDVLTGTKIKPDGVLRYYSSQITVIPEGIEEHDMFGWALPSLKKYSAGRTFFSNLQTRFNTSKKFHFDARILGGERAIIMSNQYDRVFPMDILPEYLIKAVITNDIDKMEQLGIYEVAPEDFALCEFVDTSKLEIQKIVREGLLNLKKEME